MKKNLIFLTLLISVLMVSVVSAGITGYVLELRKGVAVTDDNLGRTSVQSVSGDIATFQFTDSKTGRTETLSGTAGETITTSSGTKVEIEKATSGNIFQRARVNINVVPASESGVGASVGGNSGTGTACIQDCAWVFEQKSIDAKTGDTLTTGCKNMGEIAIEGSCYVSDWSNIKVLGSFAPGTALGADGSGWACEFLNQGSTSNSVETGALCCSV